MTTGKKLIAAAAVFGVITAFAGITAFATDEELQQEEPLSGQSALRKDSLILGANAVMLGKADGGQAPYTYSYSYKSVRSDVWTELPAEDTANKCYFAPTAAGRYDVRCTITDANGDTVTNDDRLVIWQDTGEELLNNSQVEDMTIALGKSIVLEGTAEGGKLPYEFKLFADRDGENTYKQIRSYNEEPSFTYKPKEAGYYSVKLRVRDYTGTYKDKIIRLTVTNKYGSELKNISRTDKKSIDLKETVTMKASAFGGTAPYEYKYLYKKEGGSWKQLKGYSSSRSSLSFTPKAIGFYKLRVRIRDFEGKVVDKDTDLIVRKETGKELSNESTADNTTVVSGKTVTFTAKAYGGVMPYKYKFYLYSDEKKSWDELTHYGISSVHKMKFSGNGNYRVKVGVRDANGDIRTKIFNIESFLEKGKTVSYAELMPEPKWGTRVLAHIHRGTEVYTVAKSGYWTKIRFGSLTGWINNSALGSKNTDLSDLNAQADRIIAQTGRSIQAIFNYANWTGYTSIPDYGYKGNVEYILRYRRGACYQRASLLCFLLDRAGYDVVRVSDGIDRYTGGSPHNWVIIATSSGYRHLDPTPVIGLGTFYLVTDYAISPYFSWNRNLYPACR